MEDIYIPKEDKDKMFAWVSEASTIGKPWWEHCSQPEEALAFVKQYLSHLLKNE